jgi:hypothetical protein
VGWKKDAGEEFAHVLGDMNQYGFSFKMDRLLKAGMVLADMKNIKFATESFTPDQADRIEEHWPAIKRYLPFAAKLLRSFGFDKSTLTAENVIIPVAYYAKVRNLRASYVVRNGDYDDRERVRAFVVRSLLKGSFWTGAVDAILLEIRRILSEPGLNQFPLTEVNAAMVGLKKPLTFSDEEIDRLLSIRYGQRAVTLVLSLLYPGIELNEKYHQDHVFPRGLLSDRRLRKAGLDDDEIARILQRRDQLPNLQLLRGELNQEKSRKHPAQYIASINPPIKRQQYLEFHDLEGIPGDLHEVSAFFANRKSMMRDRLKALLGS